MTQVKEMIKMKTVIPPKKQIVNCNGKKLEDGKIMGDYGIQKGHSLFMTCSLHWWVTILQME